MDDSRRLILIVLALVMAKTIEPSIPLYFRYYLYLAWYAAAQVYGRVPGLSKSLRALPLRALKALARRINRTNPHCSSIADYIRRRIMPGNNSHAHDDESIAGLTKEILHGLRREAVSRLPLIIHSATDRLLYIYSSILRPAYTEYYLKMPYHDYVVTALGTAAAIYCFRRLGRRVRNAAEVPLEWYSRQRRLSGWCVAVSDSDNIRFWHAPTPFHRRPVIDGRMRRLETINVRLAGIDAPEMGHFGGTDQPYAKEAKDWLSNEVLHRRITITLHRLDQYSRVIGSVAYWPDGIFWRAFSLVLSPFTFAAPKSLSLEMVKAGFATVYENAGAEYGGLKTALIKAEQRARKARLGMWQQTEDAFVHPSEYKKMRVLNAALNGLSSIPNTGTRTGEPVVLKAGIKAGGSE